MIRPPKVIELAVGLLVALSPGRLLAQSSLAEQLFLEGKTLMRDGHAPEACAKFKASHDLDPTATGTLLNLALCHEQIGKAASAWAEFRQVAAESEGKRVDRVEMAREHEAKLKPLLAHVTIVVAPDARTPGLVLQLDHEIPIPDAAWGTPVPIDPGPHTLAVAAPGKVAASMTFDVGAAGTAQEVVVAPLATEERATVAPATDLAPDRSAATRRVIGLSVGGAGVIALGVGAFFGLRAASKNDEAKGFCDGTVCPNESARSDASAALRSANSAATTANVAVGVGAVLAAAGIVLFVTSSPRSAPRAALVVGPSGGSVALTGAF